MCNYSLAEQSNERKIKFLRYVTRRACDGFKESIERMICIKAVVTSSAKKDVKVLLDRT
jgi:hypothetical protein